MDFARSSLELVSLPLKDGSTKDIWVKRDDQIDAVVSGNKWRKLKYAFAAAKHAGKTGVLTYGGAYSNHLVATAKAAELHGFNSIGIVRGEELTSESNETLRQCAAYGMELQFVSRTDYKAKDSYETQQCVKNAYSDFMVIPEGGASFHGIVGCQEILKETPNDFDHIFLAAGTGTTATGVLMAADEKSSVHIVSALKGEGIMMAEIRQRLKSFFLDEASQDEYLAQAIVHEDYHFGGYGKWNSDLLTFIQWMKENCQLPLDPIYTGKAFFALSDQMNQGHIAKDSKVLFIHTGGLQGWNGILTC